MKEATHQNRWIAVPSLTGVDVVVAPQARLVMMVNAVAAETNAITRVRSDDVTVVSVTCVTVTETLTDIATDVRL